MSRIPKDKLASFAIRLPSLPVYLASTEHRPTVGLTTGGSGRKNAGCRKAASNGMTENAFNATRLRRVR